VCENHPGLPWRGGECCSGAGTHCPNCMEGEITMQNDIDTVWSLLIEAGDEDTRWTAEKIVTALLPSSQATNRLRRVLSDGAQVMNPVERVQWLQRAREALG
jgi:hypothetical protein